LKHRTSPHLRQEKLRRSGGTNDLVGHDENKPAAADDSTWAERPPPLPSAVRI
jgi:hypothetical protein